MKAVIFDGKEKMHIADLPKPSAGPGEIVIKVAACGICGGDARSFFNGDQFTGVERIPGHEPAGVIEEVGSGIGDWKPGDRIALAADVRCDHCWYCRNGIPNMCATLRILGKHVNGGLCEYMRLTPDLVEHGILNRIPDGVSLLHAAISEPMCSVLASHDELGITENDTVLIMGSGPMGILHFELLRPRRPRVILVDMATERLERARKDFGAELTIEASREDVPARVKELTGGLGADVVITAAPAASAVAQSIHLARKRGRIGLFGGLPAAQAEVGLDINIVHYRELHLVGNFSYHPRYHARALELLASGAVRADKLITTYPIEGTERGLYDIREGKVLKAVVVPNGAAA